MPWLEDLSLIKGGFSPEWDIITIDSKCDYMTYKTLITFGQKQ